MNNKKIKIAVVNSHPVHYFQAMYQVINKHPNIDLTVLFLTDFGTNKDFDPEFNRSITWNLSYGEGYDSKFLCERINNIKGFFSIKCPKIWTEITQSDYDVIWIHGYNYFGLVLAFLAAKFSRKKIFFRSETHLKLNRHPVRQFIRDAILAQIFRFFDGFLAIGSLNSEYYKSLGVPAHKITLVPYTIDNDSFYSKSRLSQKEKHEFLNSLGLNPNVPTMVYCSKFSIRKNPDIVIRAFHKLSRKHIQANLLMVGSGPLLDQCRQMVAHDKIDNVYIAGFIGQEGLPKYLGCSDLFIQVSENEPWGLVVNEAMATGLPVLANDTIGSVQDLVEDGVNGLRLKELTAEHLEINISALLSDTAKLKQMGKHSLDKIAKWNFQSCRKGLIKNLHRNGFET